MAFARLVLRANRLRYHAQDSAGFKWRTTRGEAENTMELAG